MTVFPNAAADAPAKRKSPRRRSAVYAGLLALPLAGLSPGASAALTPIPDAFSEDYLSGETLFYVGFDTGSSPPQPVVQEVQFLAGGQLIVIGRLNGDPSPVQLQWTVAPDGGLLTGDPPEPDDADYIACDHGTNFLRAHYIAPEGMNEVWLGFFELQAALDYAATLTEVPAPCLNGPGAVATAEIAIDGDPTDWGGIDPVLTDPAGDQDGSSATDLTVLYAALGDEQFAVGLGVDGEITFPHTPSQAFSHYEVGLFFYSDYTCGEPVEGGTSFVVNNYTSQDGQNTHHLDEYDDGGWVASYPTVVAHLDGLLETGFSRALIPADARSVFFYPYVQSFDEFRNQTLHDSAADYCLFLPVSTEPDELAVDFGASGLWHYDAGWNRLLTANVTALAGWSGGLAVYLPGSGLWNDDGASWRRLSTWSVEGLAEWSGGLAVDFGGNGLWRYDGATWTRLVTWNAEDLAGWASGLAVDFGSNGLWAYTGSAWSRLLTANVTVLAGWSGGLAVYIPGSGLWNYDGAGWSRLSTWGAEGLAEWSGGLAVDFGSNGLWTYEGSTWTGLVTWNAEGLAGWVGGLAVDFGASGLWNSDGSSWSRLTTWNADDLDAVDLN